MDDFRRFFVRGLGALVPTLLTFAILIWSYALINDYVGVFVTEGLMRLCTLISAEPAPGLVDEDSDPLEYGTPIDEWNAEGRRVTIEHKVIHHRALEHPDPDISRRAWKERSHAMWHIAFAKYKLHLLGFLIAIVLVYFMGFFLASFIGRAMWRATERLLSRVPLIRAIYPHVKQVTDFLLSERRIDYSAIVAVQYPRQGMWSLGLSTGDPLSEVQQTAGEELVTVFIPSSPTPFTGYVIQAPRREVIRINVSLDDALRFLVSGGVIKPGSHFPAVQSDEAKP